MKGVIVPIDMPTDCKSCPLGNHETRCLIPGDWNEQYYMPDSGRSEHCPIFPVVVEIGIEQKYLVQHGVIRDWLDRYGKSYEAMAQPGQYYITRTGGDLELNETDRISESMPED